MSNLYDALGISQDANESEIKKAYRSMSLKYHPDRNPSEEAKSKIQTINEAYETLSDSQKKQQYDHELKFGPGVGMQGGMPGGMPGGMAFHFGGMPFSHMNSVDEFSDINNIFNMMFNGGMPQGMGGMPNIRVFHGNGPDMNVHFQQTIQKPEPISKQVQITLEQSYQGHTMPIDIERINIVNNMRSVEQETIYVNIPKGVDENEVLVLENKGHCINNMVRGDIKISFQITNQSEFQRRGLDLVLKKKILLKDALCGFSFEMNHLNGKKLCVNNKTSPSIIKPNYKKVIPNMGMVREQGTGNMIIEFDIEFPESLTEEQITGLESLLGGP